jgi:hypothetical protein
MGLRLTDKPALCAFLWTTFFSTGFGGGGFTTGTTGGTMLGNFSANWTCIMGGGGIALLAERMVGFQAYKK